MWFINVTNNKGVVSGSLSRPPPPADLSDLNPEMKNRALVMGVTTFLLRLWISDPKQEAAEDSLSDGLALKGLAGM